MNKAKICIIAAIGENRELGKDNKLLWHIPEDLKRFKELTLGHSVIIGRKTFESIGRPLPNRTNIIVTRDKDYKAEGCIVTHSIEEAIKAARETTSGVSIESDAFNKPLDRVFIIGGAQIYQQSIKFADRLYLTLVHASFPDADAFFPDYSAFTKVIAKGIRSSAGYKYTFLELER